MAKKVNRLSKSREARVADAFEGILHAVHNSFHTMYAELDRFDEELEGSSLTDEISQNLERTESSIRKSIDDHRKFLEEIARG